MLMPFPGFLWPLHFVSDSLVAWLLRKGALTQEQDGGRCGMRGFLLLSQMDPDSRKNSDENRIKLCLECKTGMDIGNPTLLRNSAHFRV